MEDPTTLVERLRKRRVGAGWGDELCQEAADRIGRLETVLEAVNAALTTPAGSEDE